MHHMMVEGGGGRGHVSHDGGRWGMYHMMVGGGACIT